MLLMLIADVSAYHVVVADADDNADVAVDAVVSADADAYADVHTDVNAKGGKGDSA